MVTAMMGALPGGALLTHGAKSYKELESGVPWRSKWRPPPGRPLNTRALRGGGEPSQYVLGVVGVGDVEQSHRVADA